MSFTLANWSCVSNSLSQGQVPVVPFMGSSTNLNSPDLFTYGSPNDNAATIMASNYFLSQYKSLSVGDVIIGFGTDTNFILQVTASSSTSVTTEAFAGGGGGGIGGSGAALQLSVFSDTSTITGSENLTYDSVNDIFNEGNGNTLNADDSPTFTSIIQQGNGNTITQGAGSTSLGDVQIGWANVIDTSSEDAFTDMWNYQIGFENRYQPGPLAINFENTFTSGLSNSISAGNYTNSTIFAQNTTVGDGGTGNFIEGCTVIGNGGTINSANNTITGAMCYGYTTTVLNNYATAMGYYSVATNQGSFVISDSTSTTPVTDSAVNQFVANFAGGFFFNSSLPAIFSGGVDTNILNITAGSNAKLATAMMTAGTAVVTNTSVTLNSFIIPFSNTAGVTAIGNVTNIVPGTGFTINGTGTGDVAYLIVEG